MIGRAYHQLSCLVTETVLWGEVESKSNATTGWIQDGTVGYKMRLGFKLIRVAFDFGGLIQKAAGLLL